MSIGIPSVRVSTATRRKHHFGYKKSPIPYILYSMVDIWDGWDYVFKDDLHSSLVFCSCYGS